LTDQNGEAAFAALHFFGWEVLICAELHQNRTGLADLLSG
jgi:hypothetical protein